MKKFVRSVALASLATVLHVGAEQPAPGWAPLQAQFLVHSGHATYAEAPTRTQSAVTIAFEGTPAKAVFDQMGPDAKMRCSSEKGDRERRTKGAACTYTAKLQSPSEPHYRCWIGVNLKTGDGDHGVSC